MTDVAGSAAGPADGSAESRRETIRQAGLDLGFLQVGFAPADPPVHADAYLDWLEDGCHGGMAWMAREDAVRRRLEPGDVLPGARSLVVASLGYGAASDGGAGVSEPVPRAATVIARYAEGRDYHSIFEARLAVLEDAVRASFPSALTRQYVDYGPVLEREHARRAGLGWIGKNTMLIHPRLGSWTLLGEVLTTAEIPPDAPFESDHCGTCERCMVACPTGAITHSRRLDARLCISYLTIELRGPIPEHLRPAIGNRVFGCDICQEVCPWNDGAPAADLAAFDLGRPVAPPTMVHWVEELLGLDQVDFRARYGDTPLARPGRDGLLRNLCVGLGNSGEAAALPALARCLDEPSALIREHALWGARRLSEVQASDQGAFR